MGLGDTNTLLIGTRFSRLNLLRSGAPIRAEQLQHEALTALAEALSCLSATLASRGAGSPLDVRRILQLRVRADALTRSFASPTDHSSINSEESP